MTIPRERQDVIDHYQDAVNDAGLGDVWAHLLEQEDTPTRGLLLGVVGALSMFLGETDYMPPQRDA